MGAQAGSLYTSLTLESSSFIVGLKKSAQAAERDVGKIQKTLAGATTMVKGFIAAAAAAGIFSAVRNALDYASSLAEVSQQLGVTTRDLQLYRFIATQVGIEQAEMDKGLQKLTRTIGEAADGNKKSAGAFRELGVAVQDSSGKLYTAGELLPRLADAFAKIEDPAKRARLETALFGKTGQQLDTLLTEGSKGINALAEEADKLGLIMGDALIAKADEAADRLTVLTKVLEVNVATAVADNADGILAFANAFVSLVSGIGDAISWLKKFGHEARQAVNVAQGWTPFGGRAAGDNAAAARARYFSEGVAWDEQERQRAAGAGNVRNAKLRDPGALPTAKGGGGRKGKSAGDVQREFARDSERGETEQLSLVERITTDLRERADLQHQRIEIERAAALAEIDGNKDYSAKQKAALKTLAERNFELQDTLINWQLDNDLLREEREAHEARLDNTRDLLRQDLNTAKTADERARVQRLLLEVEYAREKLALDELLARHDSTEAEKAIARARKATLDKLKAGDLAEVDREALRGRYAEAGEEMERQLYLARMRGDSADALRRQELKVATQRRAAELIGRGQSEADALAQAEREAMQENRAFRQGEIRDTIKGGFRAALEGDFGGWFEGWWKDRVSRALEDALNGLADVIQNLFSKAGSDSGGGVLGTIGKIFGVNGGWEIDERGATATGGDWASGVGGTEAMMGDIPGFKDGGDFKIGGRAGIDRNLVMFRGTAGEHVNVRKGGQDLARQPIELVVRAEEGEMFRPTVRSEAAGVSIRYGKAASKSAGRRARNNLRGA